MTASRFAAMTDLAGDDTMFGPQFGQQAWSAGDPAPEVQPFREHHTWSTTARRGSSGTLVAVPDGAKLVATVTRVIVEVS